MRVTRGTFASVVSHGGVVRTASGRDGWVREMDGGGVSTCRRACAPVATQAHAEAAGHHANA